MTLTSDAKAVVALTTRLGSRERPSLTAKKWHQLAVALKDSGQRPADVFDRSFDPGKVPGLDAELAGRIGGLLEGSAAATLEADDLNRKGIWTVTIVDDAYPRSMVERLGAQAPPVLFGCGDAGLMSVPGIGVVGSREINEAGAEVAKSTARVTVAMGRTLVSGGARGVDQLAMNAAFQGGGSVIGVLADSLIGRIRKPDVLEALDVGNICLITQQAPSSGFTPASAMSRNKLVYALAAVTVVVASAEGSGGTWAGAAEAIRAGNGIVAAWRGDGEGPGNAALEALGARPVTDVTELKRLLETEQDPTKQLSLDLAPQ